MRVAAGEQGLVEAWKRSEDVMSAQLRGLRPDALSDQAASRVLDHAIAIERAACAAKLLLAERATTCGGTKAAEDLARRSGTSKRRAKDQLDTAKRLKDQPEVQDALRQGQLSEDQATAIADAAAVNPDAAGALVDKARNEPLGSLRDACSRAKAAADPDPETTHARIHARRYFRNGVDAEGAFTASIRCTTADGARLMAHLEPFRDEVFRANRDRGVRDPFEATQLDALIAMAEAATVGDTRKAAAQVNVTVDWHALMGLPTDHLGDEAPAYIAGMGPIPISKVHEILADAFLVGLIRDGTDITKVRRYGRHIPPEIRDAVMVRARYRCSTPGCTNWAFLELDHIHPHSRGGEVSTRNIEPLCTPCHRIKTERDRLAFDDSG